MSHNTSIPSLLTWKTHLEFEVIPTKHLAEGTFLILFWGKAQRDYFLLSSWQFQTLFISFLFLWADRAKEIVHNLTTVWVWSSCKSLPLQRRRRLVKIFRLHLTIIPCSFMFIKLSRCCATFSSNTVSIEQKSRELFSCAYTSKSRPFEYGECTQATILLCSVEGRTQ